VVGEIVATDVAKSFGVWGEYIVTAAFNSLPIYTSHIHVLISTHPLFKILCVV